MEITSLCLFFSAATVSIIPNRSQFFWYETITLSCPVSESSTAWTVMRNTSTGDFSPCKSWGILNKSSCTIEDTYPQDKGVYWCQSERGECTNAINVTVLSHKHGVILQSPAIPVEEGDKVSLYCTYREEGSNANSDFTANFYKGDSFLGSHSDGTMTFPTVSMSNEGFYKCKHPKKGESPLSWLSVRDIDWSSVCRNFIGFRCFSAVTVSIIPNRSQFFWYETITLSCPVSESSTAWTVMRNTSTGDFSPCKSWGILNKSSCTIEDTYPQDKGVYWCQSKRGKCTNAINVTVSPHRHGVILQSPAIPVEEGDKVSLYCTYREEGSNANSDFTANFYKGDSFLGSHSDGTMTFPTVSMSNEGFYKCKHPTKGESPLSWLSVRAKDLPPTTSPPPLSKDLPPTTSPPTTSPPPVMSLPRIICTVLLIILYIILTIVCVKAHQCWKKAQAKSHRRHFHH